jgi:hypothetical protein
MNNRSRDKARAAESGKDHESLGKAVQAQVKNNNPRRTTSHIKATQLVR